MSQTLRRIEHQLDDWGRPAWLAAMVGGFIIFWPVGLAILGYMIWSGRMGCSARSNGRRRKWAERWETKMNAWGMQAKAFEPTGNRAFDEYREETLKRLEQEAKEFTDFLERLRMAKDRQEFEDFMRDRQRRRDEGEAGDDGTSEPSSGINGAPEPGPNRPGGPTSAAGTAGAGGGASGPGFGGFQGAPASYASVPRTGTQIS